MKLLEAGRTVESNLWESFVSANLLNNVSDINPACLGKVDTKDYKEGALTRCGSAWFDFVCLLEGLHDMNFTARQAYQHRGNLLAAITTATEGSTQVWDRFNACLPSGLDDKAEATLREGLKKMILHWFTKMKGRDIISIIRTYWQTDMKSGTLRHNANSKKRLNAR
jgi:hypothetical protein